MLKRNLKMLLRLPIAAAPEHPAMRETAMRASKNKLSQVLKKFKTFKE